jgi:iduronate 2-sulfatase
MRESQPCRPAQTSARLILACLLLSCASAPTPQTSTQQSRSPQRPNVLFIAVDDLRPELGCYGVDHADTPHLDEFASSALLFKRHYANSPSCGPSRYALLTGRSPRNSGVTRNNQALYQGESALSPEAVDGAQSLPELFRRNGYHTTLIGKLSHTADGKVFAYDGSGDGREELPRAWDEYATPHGEWRRGWGAFFAYAGGRHREDGGNYSPLMEFVAEQDTDLPDGLMAERALQTLREASLSEEPFFLGLGFFKPHLPFVATRGDWEAMQAVDIPPPPAPDRPASAYWHASGEFRRYQDDFEDDAALNTAEQLEVRRAYAACVRFVDRQVGRVLDELEALGLADDTIVVIWGDHGWHLGDSAMWGKHSPHERALRSALILRAPGATGGTHTDALAESIDLYPTLAELAGLEDTHTRWPLDGVSLAPVIRGESESVREVAVSHWGRALSVRGDEHRWIATVDKEGALTRVELYAEADGADPRQNLIRERPEVAAHLSNEAKGLVEVDSD